MGDTPGSPHDGATTRDRAELVTRRILAGVDELDRSNPAILREIRDSLEVEIMIDRSSRARRRLLRTISEFCDQRIRDKERGSPVAAPAGFHGALRHLVARGVHRQAPGRPD